MTYIIPQELQINMNEEQTKVEKKEDLINNIKSYNNPNFLEYYNKSIELYLKNNPKLKIKDVIEILEVSNLRINQLKGIDKITEVVAETKKEVSNLNNIEVIYTPYYINDKNKNGFSYDTTYVKIKDELYEVRNVERIMAFLGNKEIIKDFSEYEIIKFIKENSNLIKTNYLKNDENKITSEEVEEEINKESDMHVRNALIAHKDDVIKEREKLQEYINKNDSSSIVKYGINSNEERLYFVGDKIIKFVGKNREMQILDSKEIENLKQGDFEQKRGYQENVEPEKYNELKDFEGKENILNELVDRLYNEEELTTEELDMLTNFLELYIENKENNIDINEEYNFIVEKWYENSSIDKKFQTEKLSEVYERIRKYRKNRVKMYEPDKIDLNNSAFISTFVVLETGLVIGFIIALIMLFK